jgi:hypothetical protein
MEADFVKLLTAMLVLTTWAWGQGQSNSQPGDDGSWLFALKGFPELRFDRTMLPASGLVLLDASLSVDKNGRVHDVAVTPGGGALSDSAAKSVKNWHFLPGQAAQLKCHICLGQLDDGQGIGLPCYIYGPETAAHLRLRWSSSGTLSIQSNEFHPSLSPLAQAQSPKVAWVFANILIAEDGLVIDSRSTGDSIQRELAKQMTGTIRFRPVHLSGHPVEMVADFGMPVP